MEFKFDNYHKKVLDKITVIGHNVKGNTAVYKTYWKDGNISTVIDNNIVSVLIKLDTELNSPDNIEKIEIANIESMNGLIINSGEANDIDVISMYAKADIYA